MEAVYVAVRATATSTTAVAFDNKLGLKAPAGRSFAMKELREEGSTYSFVVAGITNLPAYLLDSAVLLTGTWCVSGNWVRV